MKGIIKVAVFAMVAGFATAAVVQEVYAQDEEVVVEEVETTTESVQKKVGVRTDCDWLKEEVARLSKIEDPDEETQKELDELKLKQRRECAKRAGRRAVRTIASTRSPIAPTVQVSEEENEKELQTEDIPADKSCDKPDENGCCPGEKYTDMGELGFNCCPEDGNTCYPPMEVPKPKPQEPELTEEEIAKKIEENINAGLCADGTKPNKFGCCGDEKFKDLGDTIFGCCSESTGKCFPPIKK